MEYGWKYSDTYEFMERTRVGMPPVMICVACNGGIQGKELHPSLPETADEIGDSVSEAYVAGASMVHIHARNPKNLSLGAVDAEAWHEVNSKVRERCPDIIINNTTGGDLVMTMEQRLQCLEANPEVASLNLTPDMSRFTIKERKPPLSHPRPEVEYDICIPLTYGLVERFAQKIKEKGVKPEIETYHTGGAWVLNNLIEKNLVTRPYLVQTVMGVQTASYPTPGNVLRLLEELPNGVIWLCSGIGQYQLPLATFAIVMGGHVRVGLEDNLYHSRGKKYANNAEPVERMVRIAHEQNREIATPKQVREMLGLSPNPSTY